MPVMDQVGMLLVVLLVVHFPLYWYFARRSSSATASTAAYLILIAVEGPIAYALLRKELIPAPLWVLPQLFVAALIFSVGVFWWMYSAVAKRFGYRRANLAYTVQKFLSVGFFGWLAVSHPIDFHVALAGHAGGVLALLLVAWMLWGITRKWGGTAATFCVAVLAAGASAGLYQKIKSLPPTPAGVFNVSEQVMKVSGVLTITLFVGCVLFLVLPLLLNWFEKGDFIPFVAARHVRSKKSGFLTVISLLSILGVALSSIALCWVISIMGGFGVDLKTKILNNNANIRIESPDAGGFEYWREIIDESMKMEGVAAATPVAGGEVMASSTTTTAGVQIRGIETSSFRKVVEVPDNMEVGSFDYLDDPLKLATLPPDTPIHIGPKGEVFLKGGAPQELSDTDEAPDDLLPGVVLGRELARSLHAYVGDELTLVSPMGDLGPMGLMPRSRKFRVAGIFYTGMYEYDASHAYVKMEDGQELLDLKHFVTAVDIRVDNVELTNLIAPRIEQAIGRSDLKVRDWKEMNRNLFSALQLEKLATFVILSIAIAVASFCIICTLLLMVTEKSKEIAIMKALGASDRAILQLFLTEGMLIGGVGTLFGVILGFTSMFGLEMAEIRLDPEVYYIERLPVTVDVADYGLIAVCAFLITSLATIYPAVAASKLSPVDGIRYE